MGFKKQTVISAVSEWVQKTNTYQRCSRKSLNKQSLTTAASNWFFLKKNADQRFFRMGLRRPALFQNEFDETRAD